MSDTVVSKVYRILRDSSSSAWDKISFWTKAVDVEAADGKTLETKIGAIDGVTSDVSSDSTTYAASIKSVHDLNTNLTANVNGVSVPFDFRNVDGKYGFINEEDEFMPFGSLALSNVADVAGGDITSYTFSNDYKEVYVFAFAAVYNGGSLTANFTASLTQGTKTEIWHRATFVGYYCGDMVIVKLTNIKAGDSISIGDGYGNSITRAAIFTTDN